MDKDPTQLATVLKQAYEHPGCSFVEIYQDCNIFNHGAFDEFSLKSNRAEQTVLLQEGQPMLFGADNEWGLALKGDDLQRVARVDAVEYCHDTSNFFAAMRLAQLTFPEHPVPLGVYYQQAREVYALPHAFKKTRSDLSSLYRAKATWQQG